MRILLACAAFGLSACASGVERAAAPSEAWLASLSEDAVQSTAPSTNAIVVMRDGERIAERYFNDAGPDTLHNTRSATKTVTAMLAGIAVGDGALALDTPVWPLLGDASGQSDALKQDIRVRDLLTMSSALDCNDADPASPGNEEGMYPQSEWARWAAAIPSDAHYLRDGSGLGPFRYCTGGIVLLGRAIANATGQPLDEYAASRLFAPLGIVDAQWSRSPSNEPMPGGGLELSARDLAKLGAVLAEGGRWQGRQIVPAAFVEQMLRVQRQANAEQDYGYLIWGRTYALSCGQVHGWYMAGNGGSVVLVLPERRLVVVLARSAYNTRGMHAQSIALLERDLLPPLVCGG